MTPSTEIQASLEDGAYVLTFPDGDTKSLDDTSIARAAEAQPNLVPEPLGLDPSFGFGDRLGLGTPGHAKALQRAGGPIKPIFAQQSIREMTRTDRMPEEVMQEAQFGMIMAGYDGTAGADADHLKTRADVDRTVDAGFTFFTIDPSDKVDEKTDRYDRDTLQEAFDQVRDRVEWYGDYLGSTVRLETGTEIEFTEENCKRCAVKYGRAINHAVELSSYIDEKHRDLDRSYEIEISVDETEQPTTPVEHYIIADQLTKADVRLVSLAPRYVGEFEKGVDYKGDLDQLKRSLEDHAAIAREIGPYKLSLHSGSDKQSMYPAFARATRGRFHVKTAGTSYLEALRVTVRHAPDLFREIIDYARDRYPEDRKTYHVSATLEGVPAPDRVEDVRELEKNYLERWPDVETSRGFTKPGRQILHCTYGSVLTHETLGPRLQDVLESHLETYTKVLEKHFRKHLEPLHSKLSF